MKIYFEITGNINAKSLDESIDILEMMSDDWELSNVKLHVDDGFGKEGEPRFDIDVISTGISRNKDAKEF